MYRIIFRFLLFCIVALPGCRPDPLAGVADYDKRLIPDGAAPNDAKLIVALSRGNLHDFSKTLAEGANYQVRMTNGQTLFDYAMVNNHPEFIGMIVSRLPRNESDRLFLQTAAKGNPKMLLAFGNALARKELLQEALVKMAGSGDLPTTKEKPLFTGDDGRRLAKPAKKSLDILLRLGAQINKGSIYGWTPLMEAAKTNRSEMAYELLQRGANWKAKTKEGKTALDIARASRSADLIYGSVVPLLETWQSGKHPKRVNIAK